MRGKSQFRQTWNVPDVPFHEIFLRQLECAVQGWLTVRVVQQTLRVVCCRQVTASSCCSKGFSSLHTRMGSYLCRCCYVPVCWYSMLLHSHCS